jgi:nondiscriminating glutamyl-tRNA synthetase
MPAKTKKFVKPGTVRVRMAPSPTGPLHIGTARTALFNYLFAKKNQGVFVLRIEDTDLERSDKKFEKEIVDGLRWLGILWDEGVETGGDYAPYRQSERIAVYAKRADQLLKEGKAYHCFCKEEDLAVQRQDQLARGLAPKYSGKCRRLGKNEIKKYLAEGRPSIIRFKTPAGEKISFDDLLRGRIVFDSDILDDFAIAKNIGLPLYNFAVVIDDFEMKITHVIRGEDHVSNTPKQILLQRALDFPQPQYAHLPLILGPDRTKMSKRHGPISVFQYRENGYLPEALVNFMALLGWNPGTEREIFSLDELSLEFDVGKVQKSPAVFNIEKLNWMNGYYIRQKPIEELTNLCIPFLEKNNLIKIQDTKYKIQNTDETVDFEWLGKIVGLEQSRLKTLGEIGERTAFFFAKELKYPPELLKWKNMGPGEISASLDKSSGILSGLKDRDFNAPNLKDVLTAEAEAMGDRGKLLWPLRVALCGMRESAGPFEIAEILGKDKCLKRIKEAKEKSE